MCFVNNSCKFEITRSQVFSCTVNNIWLAHRYNFTGEENKVELTAKTPSQRADVVLKINRRVHISQLLNKAPETNFNPQTSTRGSGSFTSCLLMFFMPQTSCIVAFCSNPDHAYPNYFITTSEKTNKQSPRFVSPNGGVAKNRREGGERCTKIEDRKLAKLGGGGSSIPPISDMNARSKPLPHTLSLLLIELIPEHEN